ncbi:protein phosphatase PHLPP-like protein [Anabrus simplex]|uniref:protein phosphatase PHLPP-like protein n=1 Tax=Anabrus simplex TaxID=316456 RepID=UPI0035A2ECDE
MVKVNIIEVKPIVNSNSAVDEKKEGEIGSFRLPARRHSRRLASTRGLSAIQRSPGISVDTLSGWVRVFTGAEERSDRGTLVYLTETTNVRDVCRDLVLTEDVSIWVQYGGGPSRRLQPTDTPLAIQDNFLSTLGYSDRSRRARLGIDPELRHLLRFHVGPAALSLPQWTGFTRCGSVQLLKGLVFPQWRRRPVVVLASKLLLYPGTGNPEPEVLQLSGGEISERSPRAGRLVLRVTPGEGAVHGEAGRHVFLGFNQPWERDLWREWLTEVTRLESGSPYLDLSDGGLERLPDSLLAFTGLRELALGRNRLGSARGAADLELLARLPALRALHIPGNAFHQFPSALLQLPGLVQLDLADNGLSDLPYDIYRLTNLQELRLERNSLRELPGTLTRLSRLSALLLAHNQLGELPAFLLAMRALTLLDLQGNRVDSNKLPSSGHKDDLNPLGRVNLRANLLKGCIVLGNYGNLTQLDVSENSIESLDLSALTKLESLQCSRNNLVELTLNGKSLVSLIAGNNKLQKLTISPPPVNLKHLDVSYNDLEMLPSWTASCSQLRALFASHNHLRSLPDHLFCSESSSLHTLQLSYNQLASLPAVIRHIPLQELFLQSNSIAMLPANFLKAATRMRVLNLSNNRLCELPVGPEPSECSNHQLEKMFLTANCLTDSALDVIGRFANLRTLHAAYNCINTLPESCIAMWKDLEELVLSGNKLQYLPENIIHLEHLRVLRVHSNRLQTSPCFAKMTSLKVLDLAHNQLDRINLATLVPPQLQFLDLSCNTRLYVDPRQFQVYRNQRPMSLVDVSGQNRTCLPSTPYHEGGGDLEPPWKIGFSETAGLRERLYVTQIRLPAFCNTEGLFGLFDGGNNNDVPSILTKAVPRILLEERTVKETANEYMKYTMLSAHRELKEKGQKYGVCATLCHITRTKVNTTSTANGFLPGGPRYILRVASIGEAGAVLCRRSEGINLSRRHNTSSGPQNLNRNQLGCSAMFPLVIPDPYVTEILLEDEDEFLIIANKRFWEVVSIEEAVEEARHMGNPILAAKKLQDLAQSYGSEENLSIMVIRFSNLGSDMDLLMRELRNTIRKNKQHHVLPLDDSGASCCQDSGQCSCHVISAGGDGFYNNRPVGNENILNGGQYKPMTIRNYSCPQRQINSNNGNIPDADRSSPSGQSDQASGDYTGKKYVATIRSTSSQHSSKWETSSNNKTIAFAKPNGQPTTRQHHQSVLMHENGTKKMSAVVPGALERRSYRDSKRSSGGVLKAIRAKLDGYSNGHLADAEEEETGSDRSGTQLSEEQFKCWEYMLEQNTQMLFDKELDTLSRGFTRGGLVRPVSTTTMSEPLDPAWSRPQSASLRQRGKALSRSSPQLAEISTPAPFLSRHFGSARSFNPVTRSMRFGSGRQFLNGGPNAAYFGSLQRLMPYNLEYNFSVIQERGNNQDSLEQDGRMQQYWGVATTEL